MNTLVERHQSDEFDNCSIPGEHYVIKQAHVLQDTYYVRCSAGCGFRMRFKRDQNGMLRKDGDT